MPAKGETAPEDELDVLNLIKAVEDGFNQRDEKLIEQAVSDRLMDHSKYMGGVDLRQRLQLVWQAMPDARLTVDDYIVQGNTVAARWTVEGTHEGQIWAVPPSGKHVMLRGISLAYVQDGKATEYWEFPDVPGLIEQLEGAG